MKVYVGMSGGVDSSLTAALLKEQGYDVTGIFMKNWTRDIGGFICPWRDDLTDAKRVAVKIGIEFDVFDFEKQYKHKVVDYMLDEYKAGRTPNPDVMCNQEIKFKLFLNTALENGADMIATGHYARIEELETGNQESEEQRRFQLKTGIDKNKDQSYFLYRITETALNKTLMPIGELHKPQVREMAKKRGLFTADKPDSQGICFVGEVGIADFIREFVDVKPGRIIDKQTNQEIGIHKGSILYTIGQRHGLGVGGGLPYYVTSVDVSKNKVYVTTHLDDDELWRSNIEIENTHWINELPNETKQYEARIRYRAPLVKCHLLNLGKNKWQVSLVKDQKAITPGQSVVIYDKEIVVGGGIIS